MFRSQVRRVSEKAGARVSLTIVATKRTLLIQLYSTHLSMRAPLLKLSLPESVDTAKILSSDGDFAGLIELWPCVSVIDESSVSADRSNMYD